MNREMLVEAAKDAMMKAYAPYSGFFVGAALLCRGGKVYSGANIENSSYGVTSCAERTALFKAVSEGEREFEMIAIVAGPKDGDLIITAPCGVCRQVMMEFCDYETFRVFLAKSPEEYEVLTLKELLPFGFGPNNLA